NKSKARRFLARKSLAENCSIFSEFFTELLERCLKRITSISNQRASSVGDVLELCVAKELLLVNKQSEVNAEIIIEWYFIKSPCFEAKLYQSSFILFYLKTCLKA
ncbi:MAG: hypothetical protein ACI9VL_001395, partial [Colwellia sp.]